jgi:hypothetical protein
MSNASRTSGQHFDLANAPAGHSTRHWYRRLRSNAQVRWSIYALLAAFCIYRLAVFRPLPLDAPGTLRPILYALFHWFLGLSATREEAFAKWSTICSLVLFVPAALAILHYGWRHGLVKLPRRAAQILCSRWLFFASVGTCLTLCRYPTLIQEEFNPDEGAFIAAAFKLFYDPNYFHSVDCGTNGPLNIYPLMLPAIFGISPDFASSRVLVIIIVVLCAFLLHRAIALIAPEELARFAILPFVGAMAAFKNTELRHYSSEYVPLLLIAIALYLSVRVLRSPARYQIPVFLLGFISCAAFFAKIQSVPIVLSLALVALAYVYAAGYGYAGKRWRPALLFTAGTIPLMLINAALCLSAGVWKDFWISYIRANVYYAEGGAAGFVALLRPFTEFVVETQEIRFFLFTVLAVGVAYLVERVWRRMVADRDILVPLTAISVIIAAGIALSSSDGWTVYTYLTLAALCMVPMYFAVLYSSKSLSLDPVGWFGFLALTSSTAAFYSIYRAHRPFRHYLLFLFLPLCTAMAWMLVRQAGPLVTEDLETAEARRVSARTPRGLAFIALLLALTFTYQSYLWSFHDDEMFKRASAWIRPGEGDFVRSVTSPGPTVFVWGWNVRPYLGSGRATATRDLMVANCFRSYNVWASPPTYSPSRETLEIDDYYQKRVVRDLRAHPPELFADVVSPGSWFINDRRYFGFERVPPLNAFVKTNYVLFGEMYEQRYYLRRDLAAKRSFVRPPKSCTPGALRCLSMPARVSSGGTLFTETHDLPPVPMPTHALIEAAFTPTGVQTENATVFNNEAAPQSFRGLRFQSIGGDRYRLLLGSGHDWTSSKPVLLPPGKPASLFVALNGNDVSIWCNGVAVDNMHLSSLMADTPGYINVGSWIGGKCRFTGAVQFFQIRDLGKAK